MRTTAARPPWSPARTYVTFAVACAAVFGLVVWGVGRRERAQWREHTRAVMGSLAEPGRVLLDPLLPAGVVVVTLAPIAESMPLEKPATLRAGGKSEPWTADEPAAFTELARNRRHALSVAGPYLAEGLSLEVPAGAYGGQVAVRAIPVDPLPPPIDFRTEQTPEKHLEVDLTEPEVVVVRWRVGPIVVAERQVRQPEERAGAGLARVLAEEWKPQGSHRDPSDRKLDGAIVRIPPTASFVEVAPVVLALLAVTRPYRWPGGGLGTSPAFVVSVQPPLPPLPERVRRVPF